MHSEGSNLIKLSTNLCYFIPPYFYGITPQAYKELIRLVTYIKKPHRLIWLGLSIFVPNKIGIRFLSRLTFLLQRTGTHRHKPPCVPLCVDFGTLYLFRLHNCKFYPILYTNKTRRTFGTLQMCEA